jgi:hypothetical protein
MLLTSDGHRQCASFLVGSKADDVQAKGDDSIDDESEDLTTIEVLLMGEVMEALDLAGEIGVEQTLDEGERGHAHEQVEWVESQSAHLDHIGDDGLEGG